ncbi:MAG: carboxypeptidase-like regulatory domain-containing protein [Acidobacteriota bacterium]|nr:carboxypeptidase-like regulatory domain-containing protein [Acidobacteriota bacterium]
MSLTVLPAFSQDTVTGAFEGTVTNALTGDPIEGATAEIANVETGVTFTKRTDARGRFYQGLLTPGVYRVRVSMNGYQPREVLQRLNISRTGEVVPVPVSLDPAVSTTPATPTIPVATPAVTPTTTPAPTASTVVRSGINTLDARLSASFTEAEFRNLPLGGTTLTRTFDELTLLLPGVAAPPQTLGSVAGPGVGSGIGSAGQFAVNGLRSRGNNFTVDGSDNNDEDIGVRRQGFVALTPQPIESIREYQTITLLPPAQFGRNLGAQVNAVSKSGGNQIHGTVYGFFNSSQLSARKFFDTAFGNATSPLLTADGRPVLLDGQPLTVRNQSGGEDSFTLAQGGFAFGGPIRRERTFYFLSAEGQHINATKEESFAVPTVEQRGAFGTGATGITVDPFSGGSVRTTPTSSNGDLVFSFFPFANNALGPYGVNTFTQVLPSNGRGLILSAKLDHNFKLGKWQQSLTGRFNYTNDRREIPATGQAIFSTIRPRVRAQNLSLFFNSQFSDRVFNQVRLSYGRTRLKFDEVRDTQFQIPSDSFKDTPFLLNAQRLDNNTTPGGGKASAVIYNRAGNTTETLAGPLGQIQIAGFSPIGVDAYNFPQRRVNNTYQLADVLTWRTGEHALALGFDVRRSELNSDLPRVFRPVVTFNGAPRLVFDGSKFIAPAASDPVQFIRPEDLAAMGAASNFFLTLTTGRDDASINLRFFQTNLFVQDEWKVRPNLTLSYGLRYEYNSPPRELNNRIESTFNDPALNLRGVEGLKQFIDGRSRIFDPDRNNFAPRVSIAYSPKLFGKDRATVFRAGFGYFYDQILGAVVSQSRNVYPTFLTLNFGGLRAFPEENVLTFINPARVRLVGGTRLTTPGTVNQLNPQNPLNQILIDAITQNFPNAISPTLPTRKLAMPESYQYSFSFEQQLNQWMTVGAAYVGTQGRHLLRFTTPNLGPATNIVPTSFLQVSSGSVTVPQVSGRICSPSPASRGLCQPGRITPGVGAVNQFETSANSRYDSLQLQMRGRLPVRDYAGLQYQLAYTLSSATDDVSDVFDLAGAYTLPQNSLNLAAERGPANFDARHRFTYVATQDLTPLAEKVGQMKWFLNDLQVSGIGRFQTGQPFTVNSIFDVNLDGNLTDRINTTDGIVQTGNGRQPLQLGIKNVSSLLAPVGQDGRVGRNAFRAGGLVEVNLAISKGMRIYKHRLAVRAEFFNLFNRANFGVPVRLLEAPGFGQAVNTITPGLRVQFSLKYEF